MRKFIYILLAALCVSSSAFAQRILLSTGFESGTVLTTDSIPVGWSKFKVIGPGQCTNADWRVKDSGTVFCGTNALPSYMSKAYNSRRAITIPWTTAPTTSQFTDDWLFTTQLSILTGDSLSFWCQLGTYPAGNTYYRDSLQIWVTTVAAPTGGTRTKLGTVSSLAQALNFFQNMKFNLSAFNGQQVYIGFRYNMDVSVDGLMVNLDSVFVGNRNSTVSLVDPDKVCNYGATPFSSAGIYGHGSAALNDTLYVAGGSATGTATTTVYRYAINTGIWSTGVSLPTARAGGDLVKCGSSLYYIGGGPTDLTSSDNLAYKYTPAAGWSAIANINTPVSGNIAESWGDSVIFCVAGGWSTYLTTVQVYRPASNTWSLSTPLPAGTGRRALAGGLDAGKIIVAGGYSGVFRKDVQIGTIGANANTITWAAGPDVPMRAGATGSSRPGGHAVNNKFYFITGETTPAPTSQDSIYIMNVTTNTWLPQVITGRGTSAASNYWSAVSSSILPNGKIKVWIAGGSLTGTTFPGLFVLQSDICTITGVTSENQIPDKYSLSQNYPNPFNPSTTISYALPKAGAVTLKLYDIMGREVAVLVNEVKQPGNYEVQFNGSNFASGTYFFRLTAGDFVQTKKMQLVK
jgi:hypothetical protein